MAKSKFCKHCKKETVHEEFDDKSLSSAKIIGGAMFTMGLSYLFTGVSKGKREYCITCGGVS